MQLPRAYQIVEVATIGALVDTAQDIEIGHRVFMIANTGAEAAYFMPGTQGTATASTGFLIPAGQVFPQYFSCEGNLSVISTATGTSISILYLDV